MKKHDVITRINKDSLRQNLASYTWRAYNLLPSLKAPRILDLGCGSGIPTIELAVLSRGRITAVDFDKKALDSLKEKARALDLTQHIKVKTQKFQCLSFKEEYFDIVWCEGAVAVMGFENALRNWRRFIRTDGFLVLHDEIGGYKQKLSLPAAHGYILIEYFVVPAAIWMKEYFRPLEQRITALKMEYACDQQVLEFLQQEELEVERFKQNPEEFASLFYIMQKK